MRKIKIAQIGMNAMSHGTQIFGSLKKQNDIFEIAGYALPEKERERMPEKLGIFDGYREMSLEEILSDPSIEAVTIETDEIYLTKYAQMAADHGKHIHMEKPGGIGLEAYEKLLSAMKKSGKVFHTGYMYRYNPYIRELLEQIREGQLGKIISVEAQMNCIHPTKARQWLEDLPGGMMFYLGCHLIDLILLIKGMPTKIIPLNKCSGVDGVTAQDFGMAVLEYDDCACFAKTIATELGGYARRQLVVTGEKKTVELKPLEMLEKGGLLYTGKTEYSSSCWGDMGTYIRSAAYDRYDNMMRAFGKMAAGEMENPFTYEYELELYKVLLKACGMEEA